MAFAGIRGTGDWGTDERPKSFREMILKKNPNGDAPIFALMARMKKESVDDPEFSWWEEQLNIIRVSINYTTGYISTDNTLIIDDGGLKLVAGDVLQIEKTETATYDNELVVVSSVTSDTTIVVKRGQAGSTAAADAADGAFLTKVGNVWEEGSSSPDVSSRNPTKYTNYCQIFKTAFGVTNTAKKTHARTGNAFANDKWRKTFDHSAAIEFAILFGQSNEDTSGTYPKRYMGGLREFITTNNTIFTTSPTEDTLLDALYPIWDYRSQGAGDERIGFCGNVFLNNLNKLARDSNSTRVQLGNIIKIYGMTLREWIFPQGRIAFKTHPLLNQHGRYSSSALILDPTGLIWRPMRDTHIETNIQANDADLRKDQFLTEAGIEVHGQETMAYIGKFEI
jgi:hypothetical protein